MKKRISPFLSLAFASSLMVNNTVRADDSNGWGTALAVIGGVALAAGAAILACHEESDSSLISRAENIYQDSYAIRSLNTFSPISLPAWTTLSALSESMVEEICSQLLKRYSASNLNYAVKKHLKALSVAKSDLDKRIDTLRLKHSFEKRMVIDSMISLRENIINRIDAIEKGIQTFLYYHQEYLELFESEQIVYTRYAKELAVLRDYYASNREKESSIKYLVGHKDYTQRYPYSAYLSMLNNDISYFSSLLRKLTRSYPHREKMAHQAKENMEYIRSIISTSSELEREIIQKERDELEKRERELEKRKIEKKRKKLEKLEREHARKGYRRL